MEGSKDIEEEIEISSQIKSLDDQINVSGDFNTCCLTSDKKNDNPKGPDELNVAGSSLSDAFLISKESIPCCSRDDQVKELTDLGVSVYDQTKFETEVLNQVDKALAVQEEKKRISNANKELHIVQEDIRFVKQRLNHIEKALSLVPTEQNQLTSAGKRELSAIKKEQDNKFKHLKKLEAKQKALQACISGSVEEVNSAMENNLNGEEEMDEDTWYHLKQVFASKETEEERLIRTGEMTPFGTLVPRQNKPKHQTISISEDTDFDKFLLSEAETSSNKKVPKFSANQSKPSTSKLSSNEKNTRPHETKPSEKPEFRAFTDLRAVRKKNKSPIKMKSGLKKGRIKKRGKRLNFCNAAESSDFQDNIEDYSSDDVYIPDNTDYEEDDLNETQEEYRILKKKASKSTRKRHLSNDRALDSKNESKRPKRKMKKIVDDGDHKEYIKRIKKYEKSELVKKHETIMESENGILDSNDEDYTEFEDDYKIPNSVFSKLYPYQQTAVRWLWELHLQNCGGIIGDEMGLGKTIQIIAFLIGLKFSNLKTNGDQFVGLGPVIVVCPATVMHQWVTEFHSWWPHFRVAILHESGSYNGRKENLVRTINGCDGVIITTYAGVSQHQEILLKHEWHYIILDEGHKIRNPDAQATLAVKQFRTCHRLILSGSPVQNNLKELWSLFDFIFPGKLGTLPVFMQQFSVPIVMGGYANASQVQVQIAFKCATVLRDTIRPYLLRRMKSDVKMSINLPNKNEQVLFCQLTEEQVGLYKSYINSKEISSILDARLQVFVGLINLRKICNHPDLFDGGPKIFKDTDTSQLTEEEMYGYYKRSGKMIVVEALLRLWQSQGHRVLLFTQGRQMMNILEMFVKSKQYSYMKMDGSTSISSRQPAIAKFNSDPSIFVFILTTRVGGVGVNLTGANRVILYDPDWNPSTDAQARERAWRIGQSKQVTVYRLLTAGTIEEKIYHRQIFKQFVTNRVLKDPRQRRFFKRNDLYELFAYNEVGSQGTETSAIFAGTGSEVKPKKITSKGNNNNSVPTRDAEKTLSFSSRNKGTVHSTDRAVNSSSNTKNDMEKDLSVSSRNKGTVHSTDRAVNSSSNTKNDMEKDLSVSSRNKGTVHSTDNEKVAKPSSIIKKEMEKTSLPSNTKSSMNLETEAASDDKKTDAVSESEKNDVILTSVDDKDDGVVSFSEEKRRKMMEIAKMLSQQLVKEAESCVPKSKKKPGVKDRKHRKRKTKVDGKNIEFVVKSRVYEPKQDEEDKNLQQDDYVLSKLFKKSGVHTALKHDLIVESSDPDYAIVEGEANRVAQEAIKALKESRRECSRAVDGIPTWTGQHGGMSSRFGKRKRSSLSNTLGINRQTSSSSSEDKTSEKKCDGTSSRDLIAAIRARNNHFITHDDESTPISSTAENDELLVDIRNYIAFQSSVDGQATTQELVETFRDKLPLNQTAIFKAMLNKICNFSRNLNGDGIWQLKEEFK